MSGSAVRHFPTLAGSISYTRLAGGLNAYQYLKAGLPIATGVIEGACRHLIKDQMDLTGARWNLKGAESVLRLRLLRNSGDLEEYWHFHIEREIERNHVARYAGPIPFTPEDRWKAVRSLY